MVIYPVARRSLLWFSVVASFVLTVCVITLSEISVVYPLLMGGMAFWSIYHNTRRKRRYVSPTLWSLFFILGYILSYASVLIDPEKAGVGPRKDLSLFLFTDSSFFPVFWVMVSGMAGMTLAVSFWEKLYGRSRTRLSTANPNPITLSLPQNFNQVTNNNRAFSTAHLSRFSWLWMILSLSIIGLMWALGIGRTGLPHATALPFMMTGGLVYVKNMVIPFLGFVVFVAAVTKQDNRRISATFLMLLIVGGVGAVAFLSRGFIVFMILPALIYLGMYGGNWVLTRRFLLQSGLLVFGVLLIVIPGIEILREVLYSGQNVSTISATDLSEKMSFLSSLGKIIDLVTGRIIGFRELVFVTNLHEHDVWGPWRVFAGDASYVSWLSYNLYYFEQDASGETAFGYGLGLWGMFYLSGSFLLVFIGSAIATSVVLAFEEIFLIRGYEQLPIYMAVNVGLWVWGGIDWFLLSRLIVTALFCYGLVRYTRLSAFLR